MKRLLLLLLIILGAQARAQRPDTLWYRYDNRFTPNRAINIAAYDTIEFKLSSMIFSKPDGQTGKKSQGYLTSTPGVFMFQDPGRILYKPSSMNVDFTKETSRWCFARSKESEHFVCFWEAGASFDADAMLRVAESCWQQYAGPLGFVHEGQSSTDTYKILMRVYNQSEWLASGSGEDMKVGTLNVCPWAVTSRGGATVAHEIGHTFQYLTNVDCEANNQHGFNYGLGPDGAGGNGFWEDCANWMAYKVYPGRQFTDGEYFEGYMSRLHQNLMHENSRYHNCFYQDFLCDRYGQDFIGRLWRESIRPEDPVDAIKRLAGLTQDEFSALMYDIFVHMCTWDTPSVRAAAAHRIGAQPMVLKEVDGWYQPDSAHCPQNYGYNMTRLNVPSAGTPVTVRLESLVGTPGFRAVQTAQKGWRWGFAALQSDGTTQYSPMQTDEGEATFTVPDGTTAMWLVVMGAPRQWWHHQWDDNVANDEQWPYRVRIDGARPYGLFRTYTAQDFPDDYARHDTTVVINAQLAYSGSSYSSVRVQYDMDAISEALGLTTEQLHAVKVGSGYNPRFAGVSPNGTLTNTTTTSTSSDKCYGHWFTATGNVCGYTSDAVLFAEMYPEGYGCYIGQYPTHAKQGQTYTTRQAIVYRAADKKTYRATMEVHVKII